MGFAFHLITSARKRTAEDMEDAESRDGFSCFAPHVLRFYCFSPLFAFPPGISQQAEQAKAKRIKVEGSGTVGVESEKLSNVALTLVMPIATCVIAGGVQP